MTAGARHGIRQRGFSLIELMVAMTLSLVLLAGALSILYSSKVTYAENERIARLQEAGRAVVELILRDGRATGYQGCSRSQQGATFLNTILNPTTLVNRIEQPMYGFDANGPGWAPAMDAGILPAPTAGSDVIVLRTTREGSPTFRAAALPNATAALSVTRPLGVTVPVGTKMVISACAGATGFAVSAFATPTTTTATISHGASQNFTTTLTRTFPENTRVSVIDTVIYFVAPSPSGNGPALWQRINNTAPVTPLIEGVENMQILYGIDTNPGDENLLANTYETAAAVDAANNWNNVISMTIAVLIRSETETNLDLDKRTYNLLGLNLGPFNDRRQRAVFTTTVTLRNRTT